MESLGTIFKQIRERNGITLEEIENATKIRTKYLKAIEEDKFDEIPGKVYAKGFVKSYARYLKIDQEPVIIEMIEEIFGAKPVAPEPAPIETPAAPKREEKHATAVKRPVHEQPIEDKPLNKKVSRIIGISALFVVLLLAIGGIYSLVNGRDEPEDDLNNDLNNIVVNDHENDNANNANTANNDNTDANQSNGDNTVVPKENTANNTQTVPKYDGLTMTISIVDIQPNNVDKCWLQVMADGKLLWEETLNEGASKTVTATDSIRVKAGNAGVVKITLNDHDLGMMGAYSQVVTKEYTSDSLKNEQTTYSPGAKEPVSGGIYDEQPTEVTNSDPNDLNAQQ